VNPALFALAAVTHEDLVGAELDVTRAEVVRGDLGAKELVAYVGAIALERLGARLLADGHLQGLDHRRRKGQRDVADPQVDQSRIGVRFAISLATPLDLSEEIARLEVQEGLVDPGHARAPFVGCASGV